jgi:hypothetical protein
MHPRLQEVQEFLAHCRAEVLAAVDSLPEAETMTVPEGTWSVAAILDHLRLTENSVSKLLHVTVTRLPAGTRIPETATDSVLHRVDHSRLANRDNRRVAPPIVQPRLDVTLGDALAGLEASRSALHGSMREASGVALGNFTYPHPMLGQLDLYQWLVFVGLHESRHACQIRELGETRFDP